MENRQITAAQISASSQYDANLPPNQGRLHFKGGYGSWAARANDLHQWFQINLRVEANVTFVATQGRFGNPNQRVTEYKLQYSKDGISFQVFRQHGENSDKVRRIYSNDHTNQEKQKGDQPTIVRPRVWVVVLKNTVSLVTLKSLIYHILHEKP